MASFNYKEYQSIYNKPKENQNKNYVGYFGLKNNGEEAIVRFMYNSPEEFNIFTVHPITIDKKWRKIDCLNSAYETDKCPLCMAGNKPQKKFFVKLIQYVKQEDGSIKALPKIWEKSPSYIQTLKNLMDEYGPLEDNVFKIRRNGAKGSVDTTYDTMFASPTIYKPEIYVKDTEAFKDFDFKFFVWKKTADEMVKLLEENPSETSQPQQTVQNQPFNPAQPTQPIKNQYNTTMATRNYDVF